MNVKYVKLVTGENLVAQVSKNDDIYTFKQGMIVAVTPDGQLGMMPLSTLGQNNEVKIRESHVVFVDEPDDEIKNIYNVKFGTGIVTPSASGIQLS